MDPAFKLISAVRARTGAGPIRREVAGVGRRYPVTRLVTAPIATRVIAAGAPLVTRDRNVSSEGARC